MNRLVSPRHKGALRNGDVHLSVSLSVRSFVCLFVRLPPRPPPRVCSICFLSREPPRRGFTRDVRKRATFVCCCVEGRLCRPPV